jgi:molybdopterin-guanine dinucleotide biosynthesis protein A
MSRLGAIFAGGQASRFGSDAVDQCDAVQHRCALVAALLRPQCDALVVIGRTWHGLTTAHDLPRAGLGPLGALAGALAAAREGGHATVLTSGCDLPNLPVDLGTRLSPGPAVVAGQPLLGLWPVELLEALLAHMEGDDRSMRGWIVATAARRVPFAGAIANINTPDDLARLTQRPLP